VFGRQWFASLREYRFHAVRRVSLTSTRPAEWTQLSPTQKRTINIQTIEQKHSQRQTSGKAARMLGLSYNLQPEAGNCRQSRVHVEFIKH